MSNLVVGNYANQVYILHCQVLGADFSLVGVESVIWGLYYAKLCDHWAYSATQNPGFFSSLCITSAIPRALNGRSWLAE